jgi:transposase InsO family protein
MAKYFITFIDELTRYCWVYMIPDKSSTTILRILQVWSALVLNQSGTRIQNLRTDQGTEYTGETLKTVTTFLEDNGITHETTSAYSSSSNGIAERMNRTLMNMVRPMLLKSKIPAPFWAEALNTAVKIRNRLPTSSLPDHISPHQAWFGIAPTIGICHYP